MVLAIVVMFSDVVWPNQLSVSTPMDNRFASRTEHTVAFVVQVPAARYTKVWTGRGRMVLS